MKYSSLKKALLRKQRNIVRIKKVKKIFRLYPILFSILSILFLVIIISSLVWLFANLEWFELKSKNELGDAFGGLSNPIIAFLGVIVTFLAFYIQYQFNREQSKLIAAQRREREEDKKERDIEIRRQIFDKKFYELLNIHNSNVESISLVKNDEIIKGRKCFEYFIDEIHLYTLLFKKFRSKNISNFIKESETKSDLKNGYLIFFYGIRNQLSLKKYDIEDYVRTVKAEIYSLHTYSKEGNFNHIAGKIYDYKIDVTGINIPVYEYILGKGYYNDLNIYFRFLHMFVKFVADEDENLIDYKTKREYLKIIRTQLSNAEQQLLFYNWYTGFGSKWEDNKHKFFTDYRMIHNIDIFKLYKDISIISIFRDMKVNMKSLSNTDFLLQAEDLN